MQKMKMTKEKSINETKRKKWQTISPQKRDDKKMLRVSFFLLLFLFFLKSRSLFFTNGRKT